MNLSAIIVDDVEEILLVMTDILEANGVRVLARGFNGKDAVELYEKYKPDLVFLDIKMPKYDGLSALADIKKLNPDAKVIMVTAENSYETRKKLEKIHPYDTILKPFSISDIKKILQRLNLNTKSLADHAIEGALLNLGFSAYNKIRQRLVDDYNCTFSDCYEHPEFLNSILKDMYGNVYHEIVNDIKTKLENCKKDEYIIRFEKEISK